VFERYNSAAWLDEDPHRFVPAGEEVHDSRAISHEGDRGLCLLRFLSRKKKKKEKTPLRQVKHSANILTFCSDTGSQLIVGNERTRETPPHRSVLYIAFRSLLIMFVFFLFSFVFADASASKAIARIR